MEMSDSPIKPVEWIGSSYKDFRSFPDDVQDHVGYALHLAQTGSKHDDAKPLKGFGGAGAFWKSCQTMLAIPSARSIQ